MKQPALNCPVCGCTSNRLMGVTQLHKIGNAHRPTSILGPGTFKAADIDIPLGCTGSVAMLNFHCRMGHSWAITMHEDRSRIYCVLHNFPDWTRDPTKAQVQKFAKDMKSTEGSYTQYKMVEITMSDTPKKASKKGKKDS